MGGVDSPGGVVRWDQGQGAVIPVSAPTMAGAAEPG